MADNFVANAGSGGSTFAADDISSVLYPRVKVSHGADGSATDVSTASPMPVQLIPQASGGCSISRILSAASTNATSIKGSAGQVFGVFAINLNAAVKYLKFYNKATSPTVGTDTPVLTLPIPASTTGAGFWIGIPQGIAFGTGIACAITGAQADNDTTAVSAGEQVIHTFYT